MNDLRYWLAAIRISNVGPGILNQLIAHFSSVEALFTAPEKEWIALGLPEKAINALKNPDWKSIDKEMRWAEEAHHHIITWVDDAYPALLQEVSGAPAVLYVQGDVTLLSEPQLAVVGSRNPSMFGLEVAAQFSKDIVSTGLIITSGLALGIDGAAHRGALSASGKTVAVLGSGLDCIYPRRHVALAEEIAEKGALVSEFYLDTRPNPENFPRRNRIISGLSMGVFVVEAALCSGSLITAKYAIEQGREVFALPGSVQNPLSQGGHSLIKDGAKLVETVEDITVELGSLMNFHAGHSKKPLKQIAKEKLDTQHQCLLNCIGHDPARVDQLVSRSQFAAEAVLAMLTELELWNYIVSVPGGYVRYDH